MFSSQLLLPLRRAVGAHIEPVVRLLIETISYTWAPRLAPRGGLDGRSAVVDSWGLDTGRADISCRVVIRRLVCTSWRVDNEPDARRRGRWTWAKVTYVAQLAHGNEHGLSPNLRGL